MGSAGNDLKRARDGRSCDFGPSVKSCQLYNSTSNTQGELEAREAGVPETLITPRTAYTGLGDFCVCIFWLPGFGTSEPAPCRELGFEV